MVPPEDSGLDRRWSVYLLVCADGSLYAGITTDLERRLAAHNAGKGARYTRGRGPVRLAWCLAGQEATRARRLEYAIKRLSRANKLRLIEGSLAPPGE